MTAVENLGNHEMQEHSFVTAVPFEVRVKFSWAAQQIFEQDVRQIQLEILKYDALGLRKGVLEQFSDLVEGISCINECNHLSPPEPMEFRIRKESR